MIMRHNGEYKHLNALINYIYICVCVYGKNDRLAKQIKGKFTGIHRLLLFLILHFTPYCTKNKKK